VTKKDLISHVYGKPMDLTYDYTKEVLNTLAFESGVKIERIYAIGDNPESDICGANKQNWYSILVQTGLYLENHDVHIAKAVCKDVKAAFEHILELEEKHGVKK
jgi:ribonucleotide monophosphatase NagD (HAD superfamily)